MASEPWESKLISSVLLHLKESKLRVHEHLALTDTYSIQYEPAFVDALRRVHGGRLSTLEANFTSWQEAGNPPEDPVDLNSWAKLTLKDRSIDSLLATHQGLWAWEREKFLLPTASDWKDYIYADLVWWTETLIEAVKPDAIISVERKSFPANTAFEIAQRDAIPMFTLVKTRLGTRFMVRDDLGRGMSGSEFDRMMRYHTADSETPVTDELQRELVRNGELYPSKAGQLRRKAGGSTTYLLKTHARTLQGLTKKALLRHTIGGHKTQRIRGRRLEQDFVKLSAFEFKSAVSAARHELLGSREMLQSLPRCPYILMTLHARPEDSISSLGDGIDDIAAIERIRSGLPSRLRLLVKETPLMLGQRARGTYKHIASLDGVSMLDPNFSTAAAISGAEGCIAVSGTSLLEAAILGKPTFALGRPEFEPVLSNQGETHLHEFAEFLTCGTTDEARHMLEAYLRYALQNSSADDLRYNASLSGESGKKMIRSVAKRFSCRLSADRF